MPTILIAHRRDDRRTSVDCLLEGRIRIIDDHHHSDSPAAERFRAEVLVLRGFIGDPEIRAADGALRDDGAVFTVKTKEFDGPERRLVEVDRLGAMSNG